MGGFVRNRGCVAMTYWWSRSIAIHPDNGDIQDDNHDDDDDDDDGPSLMVMIYRWSR